LTASIIIKTAKLSWRCTWPTGPRRRRDRERLEAPGLSREKPHRSPLPRTLERLGDLDPVQVEGAQALLAGQLLVLGLGREPLEEFGPLDVVGPESRAFQDRLGLGGPEPLRELPGGPARPSNRRPGPGRFGRLRSRDRTGHLGGNRRLRSLATQLPRRRLRAVLGRRGSARQPPHELARRRMLQCRFQRPPITIG